MQYDIEESSIMILKHGTSISTQAQFDIEETSISKFRTSISVYTDIEDFSISTNAPSISVYDIEAFVLRHRISCSSISVFFCRIQWLIPAWAAYSVLDTDCGVHIALRIDHYPWLMRRPGRPQPPQRRLHSAARLHPLHRARHRPQPPERGSSAGAGINGTQEREILGDKN